MNEKIKTILAGYSGEQDRSQLAPHRKLILELHRRGCSFRKIATMERVTYETKPVENAVSEEIH